MALKYGFRKLNVQRDWLLCNASAAFRIDVKEEIGWLDAALVLKAVCELASSFD